MDVLSSSSHSAFRELPALVWRPELRTQHTIISLGKHDQNDSPQMETQRKYEAVITNSSGAAQPGRADGLLPLFRVGLLLPHAGASSSLV